MKITKHGERRAHERAGLPKRAVARQAEAALQKGKTYKDFSGNFRRYLDKLSIEYKNNNLRVYSGYIYAFTEDRLITVLQIPVKYRKAAS